jgi:hypothetical protein
VPGKPFAVPADEAPAGWSPGELLTVPVTAEQTVGRSATRRSVCRGGGPPPPRKVPHLLTVETDEGADADPVHAWRRGAARRRAGEPARDRTLPPDDGEQPERERIVTLAAYHGAEVLED